MSDKIAEFEKRLKDGATLDTIATEAFAGEADEARHQARVPRMLISVLTASPRYSALPRAGVGDFKYAQRATTASCSRSPRCSNRQPPAPMQSPTTLAERYASGIADDVLDQLVAKLQSEYDVRVNQAAAESALAY